MAVLNVVVVILLIRRLFYYGWKNWQHRIIQEQISLSIATVDNIHFMNYYRLLLPIIEGFSYNDCNITVYTCPLYHCTGIQCLEICYTDHS